jgi:tetratricopeptide (TPR) repeat protein
VKIFIYAVSALWLLTGCARPTPDRAQGEGKGGEDALAKLNRLLPDFQAQVRPLLSWSSDVLKGVDSQFTKVIAYGRWLESRPVGNPDSLTIRSDTYWNAFFTMAMRDPTVYYTRIFLLIGEGRLARAQYVRIFASLHMDARKEADAELMGSLGSRMEEVRRASDGLVEKGIGYFDQGNGDKARYFYAAALGIYPKSPRANYELGLTLLTANLKEGRIDAPDHAAYFAKVREYDPFFAFAYQGPKALAEKMPIILNEIEPSLKAVSGNHPSPQDFRKFGDACVRLGEWELAAYSYHTELFMTLDARKGFDTVPSEKLAACLRELGAAQASKEILEQFRMYNEQLAQKKDKRKK